MENPTLLKILQQFDSKAAAAKYNGCQSLRKHWAKSPRFALASPGELASGFTLIEIMAALLMIGILSAIAAPSWISFINQRRVNAVNDAIFQALQQAQREAKTRKIPYSVSFKNENSVPQVAIYPANTHPNWEILGKDLNLKPGQVLLGTNLNSVNTGVSYISYNLSNGKTITFNYNANLQSPATLPLVVTVAIPASSNSTQAIEETQRCVKIKTILGSMQMEKPDKCNAS